MKSHFILFAFCIVAAVLCGTTHAVLTAEYTHEDPANRGRDMSGNGHDATFGSAVTFPTAPQDIFEFGDIVAQYNRTDNAKMDIPGSVITPGDDFTFVCLVNKLGELNGTNHTVLCSNRFRLQWRSDDSSSENGKLRVYVTRSTGGYDYSTAPIGSFQADDWYFVALRYDVSANLLEAFSTNDGDLGVAGIFYNPTTPLTDVTAFQVGYNGLSGIGGVDAMNGQFDNIRFYDSFLDDAQLQEVLTSYVPEPSTLALLLLGIAGFGLFRRRAKS